MNGLAGAPAPRGVVDANALGTAVPWAAPTAAPALPAVVQQSVKGAVDGLPLWPLHRFGVGRVRWRTAVATTVVSVVGVGVTRVWLGVHWPSEVLGGRLFGALVVDPAVIGYEWPWPGHARTAGHRG